MRAYMTALLVGGFFTLFGLPAARGDDAPAVPAKGYELRVAVTGNAYTSIRFKPATGESWHLLNARWQKLEEAVPPPAGDYDVLLIPAQALQALRLDRATGATWLVRDTRWVPVQEPAPAKLGAPAAKPGPGYALRHVRQGDQLHVLRFHTTTREAWHINEDEFTLQGETGPVPAGEYDIKMIAGESAGWRSGWIRSRARPGCCWGTSGDWPRSRNNRFYGESRQAGALDPSA